MNNTITIGTPLFSNLLGDSIAHNIAGDVLFQFTNSTFAMVVEYIDNVLFGALYDINSADITADIYCSAWIEACLRVDANKIRSIPGYDGMEDEEHDEMIDGIFGLISTNTPLNSSLMLRVLHFYCEQTVNTTGACDISGIWSSVHRLLPESAKISECTRKFENMVRHVSYNVVPAPAEQLAIEKMLEHCLEQYQQGAHGVICDDLDYAMTQVMLQYLCDLS